MSVYERKSEPERNGSGLHKWSGCFLYISYPLQAIYRPRAAVQTSQKNVHRPFVSARGPAAAAAEKRSVQIINLSPHIYCFFMSYAGLFY